MITWIKTGRCRSYSEVPKDAKVEEVNGRFNLGNCEVCGKPILENDYGTRQHFVEDSDGIIWHKRCPKVRKATEKRKWRYVL